MMDYTVENIVGRTVHVLRGTKYAGEWNVTTALAIDGYPGWATITDGERRMQWNVELADCFATETEAREVGRGRRQAKVAQPLYGDFAQLAALNGIRTDGTGRSAR